MVFITQDQIPLSWMMSHAVVPRQPFKNVVTSLAIIADQLNRLESHADQVAAMVHKTKSLPLLTIDGESFLIQATLINTVTVVLLEVVLSTTTEMSGVPFAMITLIRTITPPWCSVSQWDYHIHKLLHIVVFGKLVQEISCWMMFDATVTKLILQYVVTQHLTTVLTVKT